VYRCEEYSSSSIKFTSKGLCGGSSGSATDPERVQHWQCPLPPSSAASPVHFSADILAVSPSMCATCCTAATFSAQKLSGHVTNNLRNEPPSSTCSSSSRSPASSPLCFSSIATATKADTHDARR
jgi:hypothetical protein